MERGPNNHDEHKLLLSEADQNALLRQVHQADNIEVNPPQIDEEIGYDEWGWF